MSAEIEQRIYIYNQSDCSSANVILFLLTKTSPITHNGAHLLTDGGVACKDVGVLEHCQVRRCVRGDLQHTAPLGKPGAVFVVIGAAVCQSIQT